MNVTHKAIIQLVRKYEKEFSETRPMAFEMLMGKRGGVPVTYCRLDEEQATFLITLKQNPSMGAIMARNSLELITEIEGKYHVKNSELGEIIKTRADIKARPLLNN